MQCVHDQAGSEFRMESIGSALYTSLAFLNHSCDPNTIKYFVGNTVFLVASRPILQGEEVTDNYGPHFSLSTRISRHNWLQVKLTIIFISGGVRLWILGYCNKNPEKSLNFLTYNLIAEAYGILVH